MRKLVAIAIAGVAAVASTGEASVGSTQSASTDREDSPRVAAPLTGEEQQQAACDAMWERKRRREEAAHGAELKDPNWAYAMEQKLREYTSRRFPSSEIQVMAIDCKTTFCELRAEGFAAETSEEFDKVIDAARDESWNDFWVISTSHTEESGKTIHGAQMHRKPSNVKTREERDDEQLEIDCAALMAQRAKRAHAIRDAEPRDASWANPMEQLIREYLVGQLVKHPVEQLEVSCKMTFCRIKASGRVKGSYLAFQKALHAAVLEPWSDLRGGGEGRGDRYGDGWVQEFTFYRD